MNKKVEQLIILDYNNGVTINNICINYKTYRIKINQILLNNNIIKRAVLPKSGRKSNIPKKEVVDLYKSGMTARAIGKKFNVTQDCILYILEKQNVERRNYWASHKMYDIDIDFFRDINTPEKAYFLGWMYADGYNALEKGFSLELHKKDVEILNKFKLCLKSERPISFSKNNMFARLRISRKKLSIDLHNLGCIQKKSLILKFPTEEQVPSHLIHYFLRGYFEGDGGVYGYKQNTRKGVAYSFQIISSKCFIESLTQNIEQNVGIKFNSHWHTNNKNLIMVSGHYDHILKFLDWIYKDRPDLTLSRKYDRYLQMKYNKGIPFIKYKDM